AFTYLDHIKNIQHYRKLKITCNPPYDVFIINKILEKILDVLDTSCNKIEFSCLIPVWDHESRKKLFNRLCVEFMKKLNINSIEEYLKYDEKYLNSVKNDDGLFKIRDLQTNSYEEDAIMINKVLNSKYFVKEKYKLYHKYEIKYYNYLTGEDAYGVAHTHHIFLSNEGRFPKADYEDFLTYDDLDD